MIRSTSWTTLAVSMALLVGGTASHAEPASETEPAPHVEPVPHPAIATIEGLHVSMLETMQNADELGYQGRYDKLGNALAVSFDLEFMAQKAVGRSWKKFSPEEKQRWRKSFENVTSASSHETMIVRTELENPDGDDVTLNYRLRETPEGWRIIDVYLNGTVSELALRRSEYSSLIKRDGFESLVDTVDQRVADLAKVN